MVYIIDRIEADYAVCEKENRSKINIPLAELHRGAKEGDCFKIEDNMVVFLVEETRIRKKLNANLQNKLFE